MSFLRPVVTPKAIAVTTIVAAIPAASFAFNSTPSSSHLPRISTQIHFNCPILSIFKQPLSKNLVNSSPKAVQMDFLAPTQLSSTQNGVDLPELLTEFMVDMKCEGCVKSVKSKLQTVDGVNDVEVDLTNQVVRILGSSPVKTMTEALEQTGRKARLIGQGNPEDFVASAAVAEFKGPVIYGVVRLAQVSMELARIEANFTGLSPGKHGWSINEFGDLTSGAASTGKVFNATDDTTSEPCGDLGTLDVDEKGEAYYTGVKEKLKVGNLIGRAIAVYETDDKSDPGLTAAVIARSAGVGENYKKLCTCDGTTIWEATSKI
ncbi:oxidoreductase [Lithospermum erythrorhizon]|uniref:Superoxide dismutase copper chaperone n=1 Tax=Lithospermum erythrorhizon TaxID=34254 RepID=A0AAV3Q4G6_LITER